ncbi:hypothetical protein BT93_J0042 [Corymbia citriodora subsp. variegata]|nr:hypothetical protein BT93_J0042 [Corymbia citriodora subsp. variegata]
MTWQNITGHVRFPWLTWLLFIGWWVGRRLPSACCLSAVTCVVGDHPTLSSLGSTICDLENQTALACP